MDRLIELLNEYEENRPMKLPRQYRRKNMPTFKGGLVAVSEYDDEMEDNSDLLVISKFNGFIKRLVEKNKIDFSREGEYSTKSIEEFDGLLRDDEDGLIMLLAISDTPINDLISYLK